MWAVSNIILEYLIIYFYFLLLELNYLIIV